MKRRISAAILIFALGTSGCHSRPLKSDRGVGPFQPFLQQIEYPDVKDASLVPGFREGLLSSPPPPSVRDPEETPKWPLTLEEAIRIALSNSQVIRDLGGRVVSAGSDAQPTVFDPAIVETSPLRGEEAALSAFDAQLTTSMFMERIDRRFNNIFQASAGAQRQQNAFAMAINKTAATGTQFTLDNTTNYDAIINRNLSQGFLDTGQGGNRYKHTDQTVFQATVRHPLLQGNGVEFNRIAGPNATPGNYNGIVLARINTDIALADFERNVRDLLMSVEKTYWELYYAYRDLDAQLAGRQLALESWRIVNRRVEAGLQDYPPYQEAFAREQYYLAQTEVQTALAGRSLAIGVAQTGTLGVRSGGVYGKENQLRNLLGIPPTDGRLIVPITEPVLTDVKFDWGESLTYALTRRVELRRQQWRIKQRELELFAARNFRKPRLDMVGQYRWRGFGDDLFGNGQSGPIFNPPPGQDIPAQPQSAFKDLFSGDYQEWRFGLELQTPVGNRIGHAAVRNAELQLTRERAIMDQIELRLAADLRGAFTELDRAYVVSRSNYNRRMATFIRLQAERIKNEKGATALDLVLDAQQQAVEAESQFYGAIVDYNLALLNMHYSRGTLLDSHRVYLAEGPWSAEAHASAEKQSRRFRPRNLGHCYEKPGPVSRGAYPQRGEEFEMLPLPDPTPNAAELPIPSDVPAPLEMPSPANVPPISSPPPGSLDLPSRELPPAPPMGNLPSLRQVVPPATDLPPAPPGQPISRLPATARDPRSQPAYGPLPPGGYPVQPVGWETPPAADGRRSPFTPR